jgi:hypothetical protein
MKKPNKGQKYHNVALKTDTYSRLAKIGEKGDSFDQIVAMILKEKNVSLQKARGLEL